MYQVNLIWLKRLEELNEAIFSNYVNLEMINFNWKAFVM